MTTARGSATEACTVVVAPAVELDLTMAARVHALLDDAFRPGATVALDLRDVTFVDSSALAAVLAVHRRLRRTGGRIVLVNARTPVLRVLRLCGLTDLLGPATPSPAGASSGGGHVCRRGGVHRRERRG